ncbi:hypothetical protein WJX72_006842 [[Myrmecia] bisecta]|uniref:AMP-activated protein kinase glycogen-binding domain-containing protein n=1 Tax=[Myrmecia] bisecta TaxID=41462 RepID=A0AAW1Q3A8_9CHLO
MKRACSDLKPSQGQSLKRPYRSVHVSRKLSKPQAVRNSTVHERSTRLVAEFHYLDEYDFNLNTYMVELDKPVGLSFAPDPATGDILVHDIEVDSPAAKSRLIQVGDKLRMVSAVFGDDMWKCSVWQRVLWAVQNRVGRVKLVLERPEVRQGMQHSPWGLPGQMGIATTSETGNCLLEIGCSVEEPEESAGKPMQVTFARDICQKVLEGWLEVQHAAGATSRAAHADSLRQQLAAARELNPIPLSANKHRSKWTRDAGSNGGPRPLQPASNAVPLPARSDSINRSWRAAAASCGPAKAAASQTFCVLPWLVMTTGRLGRKELEAVASHCGLGRVLELDVATLADGKSGALPAAHGRRTLHCPLAAATAAMHRLVTRRGGMRPEEAGGHSNSSVLLHSQAGMEAQLAAVLAAWLHWYGGLPLAESLEAAELALSCPPPPGAVEEASQVLFSRAQERMSKGLPPGQYEYKYIVDHDWRVDLAAATHYDESGNVNNVVHVAARPNVLTPGDQLYLTRLEAMFLAFGSKLGLK